MPRRPAELLACSLAEQIPEGKVTLGKLRRPLMRVCLSNPSFYSPSAQPSHQGVASFETCHSETGNLRPAKGRRKESDEFCRSASQLAANQLRGPIGNGHHTNFAFVFRRQDVARTLCTLIPSSSWSSLLSLGLRAITGSVV